MSSPLLAEQLSPARLSDIDAEHVQAFNRRTQEPYRLHPELGASAYEGDIDAAPLILLLANPGYDEGSTVEDHSFAREGWPLAGLHPEAPQGLRAWWSSRLRAVIERIGAQETSKRVACLQFCPWASSKFGGAPPLPSQAVMLDAAGRCAARGATLIVMRAERYWLRSERVRVAPNRYRVNSWRSSYVSPGNLPDAGWRAVVAALGDT